jgi:hypothetical protein
MESFVSQNASYCYAQRSAADAKKDGESEFEKSPSNAEEPEVSKRIPPDKTNRTRKAQLSCAEEARVLCDRTLRWHDRLDFDDVSKPTVAAINGERAFLPVSKAHAQR